MSFEQCPTCGAEQMEAQPDLENLLADIVRELFRARTKFPGENVTLAALMEEVGELAKATAYEPRANVRAEAVQVAVMAMRMVLDGDHTYKPWRASRGLDALIEPGPPPTAQQQREQGSKCRCRGADDMCVCQNVVKL